MKRKLRSILLSKETLRVLDVQTLHAPVGGANAVAACAMSQAGDSCVQSCYINTCGGGCDWTSANAAVDKAAFGRAV
ncbi:MAG: hypothetical protein M3O15_04640 [Acidobacteriota bacterium]|nr:hypothetical protein [Acidobacteriota bacterium]